MSRQNTNEAHSRHHLTTQWEWGGIRSTFIARGPEDVRVSCRTRPFQIPMGALIPVRIRNLLAAAKNIGTTHITNGCFRLHPVEWNTGEAAGSLDHKRPPPAIYANVALRTAFQTTLQREGVPLEWPPIDEHTP
jgi:hypothetical protein